MDLNLTMSPPDDLPAWIQAWGTIIAMLISTALAIGVPLWIKHLEHRQYRKAIVQLAASALYESVRAFETHKLGETRAREGSRTALTEIVEALDDTQFVLAHVPLAWSSFLGLRQVLAELIGETGDPASIAGLVSSNGITWSRTSVPRLCRTLAALQHFTGEAPAIFSRKTDLDHFPVHAEARRLYREGLSRYRPAISRRGKLLRTGLRTHGAQD